MEGVRKWEDLQTDCLVMVFQRVGVDGLTTHVPLVCKAWYKASLNPQCWKLLDLRYNACTKQIKLAVDRSCGTAIGVFFPAECPFEDFIYVSEGCPALKVVILPRKFVIDCSCSNDCQCEEKCRNLVLKMVGKWEDLERLQLRNGVYLEEILTQVGTHCKKFEGLVLPKHVNSKHAQAIVNCVPKLKYLRMPLLAVIPRICIVLILAGCRELEEVDVSHCFGFDGEDEEILKMASHIRIFNAQGTKLRSTLLDVLEGITGFNMHGDEVGY